MNRAFYLLNSFTGPTVVRRLPEFEHEEFVRDGRRVAVTRRVKRSITYRGQGWKAAARRLKQINAGQLRVENGARL